MSIPTGEAGRLARRPVPRRAPALAFAITLALACLPAPASWGAQLEEQSTQTVHATGSPRLEVQNRSGDTEIVAWDRSDVEITVTRRARAHDDARARELLKKLSVEVENTGTAIKVKAVYPDRDLDARGLFGVLFSDRLEATVGAPPSARLTAPRPR